MTVLVAYASRHGATAGIADRIAASLTDHGVPAESRPVDEVVDLEAYDAVVLGAAAYLTHWLKPAVTFVKRHRTDLEGRPLWLFSSGPLGTDTVDAEGHDVLESAIPKEFAGYVSELDPRGTRIFFGAWDPSAPAIGLGERMMKMVPGDKSPLPAGDFRDWAAIDAWAADIAAELTGDARPSGA